MAVAGFNRSPAPSTGGTALPPPPNASAAQSVPAGGTPQPASAATVDAAKVADGTPAAANLKPAPGARPAAGMGKAPARTDGGRWVDVDPNDLPVREDPAVAEFQAE